MSKQELDISRRKLLAGLGTAGVAAAGAGLGTTAYLNDTESFTGNSMTAGTLDLKVDWQQHYYGPTEEWEYVNAHPDHDEDGEQSIETDDGVVAYSDEDKNIVDYLTCENLNHDYGFGDQGSLVALNDVKPGDEGEITFSLHLCDNPGYIWLTGDGFSETGGANTEPEREAEGDDNNDPNLADNINVELWYDEDCDNKLDSSGEEGQDLEVALVSDVSGSMDDAIGDLKSAATTFVDDLTGPDEAAAVSFASGSNVDQELTTDYQAVKDAINAYTTGGSTHMAAGISAAEDELLNGTNATGGANKVMIVLSDGEPDSEQSAENDAGDAKDAGIRIFTIALGSGADEAFLEGIASNPDDAFVAPDPSDLQSVYDDIATEVITGEQLIIGEGIGPYQDAPPTLAEAWNVLTSEANGGMIPLDGNGDMGWGAGDTAEERDCFEAGTSHCIGMHWWVPTDVGNEIQGDTVEFDLGFYAEQCRHNDGSRPTDSEGEAGNS